MTSKVLALLLATPLACLAPPSLSFFGKAATVSGGGETPLTSGLAAYWPMETFSGGLTPDVSGGGFDLKSTASITPSSNGILTNYINNGSSYLSNADNSTLGIGSGKSFTLQTWVDGEGAYCMAGKWREDDSTKRDYQIGVISGTPNFVFRVYNLADTQVIVTNNVIFKTAEVGSWMHAVAGYDDSLQQIWIQVNNGARITKSCVGVRRTSAPFVVGNDPSVAYSANLHSDEVAFWTRSLTAQDVANLYSNHNALGWPLTVTATSTPSPVATNDVMGDWVAAVAKDNADNVTGSYVPNVEMIPITRFWNGMVAAGLDTKMKAVNIMAYQYFAGSIATSDNHAVGYPIYDIHGVKAGSQWGNYGGFSPMPRSITINGMASDGNGGLAAEVLVSDIKPSTDATSQTSFGLSIYTYTNSADGGIECGATGAAGDPSVELLTEYSDNKSYFINGANPGNRIQQTGMTQPPPLGFYSGNRTDATTHKVYFANSGTAFAQHLTTDSTSWAGTYPAVVIYVLGVNVNGAYGGSVTSNLRVSYFSAHDGLSSADAQAEYNLVQAFLVEKGGGYH